MDQNAKQQIVDRLKEANNVLVTVSTNPSVDQLAACIGFTLLLNKLGKHGTAVFSGEVPSTIEFLQPEKTIEKNTDSLRDFIIALDKSKADKLKYKVEDKVVKIFITPYRTSLSQEDLEFSQGDFNVDVVVGLGVRERDDLDQAIVSHGRILHDATVISINNQDQGNLGSINWVDLSRSSLSEMLVDLSKGLTKDPMDAQMATAFMTGIVAETKRFSNEKTSPQTMTIASQLMSSGANQQLIANKLEEPQAEPETDDKSSDNTTEPDEVAEQTEDTKDGALRITHDDEKNDDQSDATPSEDSDAVEPETNNEQNEESSDDTQHVEEPKQEDKPQDSQSVEPDVPASYTTSDAIPAVKEQSPTSMILTPPTLGGQLTANSEPEKLDPSTDPLGLGAGGQSPLLSRKPYTPSPGLSLPPVDTDSSTLTSIEQAVHSPHLEQVIGDATPGVSNNPELAIDNQTTENSSASIVPEETVEEAREAVDEAIKSGGPENNLEPIAALGAQPVDLNLSHNPEPEVTAASEPAPANDLLPLPALPSLNDSEVPPPPPLDSFVSNPAPLTQPTAQPGLGNDFPAFPTMSPMGGSGVNPNPAYPTNLVPNTPPVDQSGSVGAPTPPPPVPPPMMPPPNQ